MSSVKTVEAIRRRVEKIDYAGYGDFNGMWLVANAIIYSDKTADFRLSLVSNEDDLPQLTTETILSDQYIENEQAVRRTMAENIDSPLEMKITHLDNMSKTASVMRLLSEKLRVSAIALFTDILLSK